MEGQGSLYGSNAPPLAERMRPQSLKELLGMDEMWKPGSMLDSALKARSLPSLVFWGPPGSGKTTLARILSKAVDLPFLAFSAVTSGVKEIRSAIETAQRMGQIVLFVDEIHRFNKSQQDAFLHAVEEGRIILMGATTENPSFELNAALLSRVRVLTLSPLSPDEIHTLIQRALSSPHGLNGSVTIEPRAADAIAGLCAGDARVALNLLEMCAQVTSSISVETVQTVARQPIPQYDKAGESHFNMISALHKAVRNSEPQASLYWLARMLTAGEDPLYIARRLMRTAVEDVGLADPHALQLAVAVQQAVHFMGMPECCLALAELAVYLSIAPKSNAIYTAYGRARQAALETSGEPVPLHIRNAPTALMKELHYGEGYRYAHDEALGVTSMNCMPDSLSEEVFYRPSLKGFESEIARLMETIERNRSLLEKE
ncbi:MAG TPA: replication-associated recombination protein A [Thermoanaerobaculia bacterium]|nr:replication-associated recombination protein A [Thermoanaerobaculia bacterium]HUM28728.1 replication-associated recombination protein A [Thermoanaerobaculia bacterium]HXK68022.1 replication-associated recombination protein A [Thermoanaerobaculia bacterium]